MLTHTFAICAYQDSPYLEACIKSLKKQSSPVQIIMCTSTPSVFIKSMAEEYGIPLYVREGKSDIGEDWNFAYQMADSRLVTIAHQDDRYHSEYARIVQKVWRRYSDTTVFSTGCAIVRGDTPVRPGKVEFIKYLLRTPLKLTHLGNRTWVKKSVLMLGNPIICPSCTYDKKAIGEPLFDSSFQFALDWDTMWKLAGRPGRFICMERPLIYYRVHEGAATKACIQNHCREQEEELMYRKIWPEPIVKLLMHFYKKAYETYQ